MTIPMVNGLGGAHLGGIWQETVGHLQKLLHPRSATEFVAHRLPEKKEDLRSNWLCKPISNCFW